MTKKAEREAAIHPPGADKGDVLLADLGCPGWVRRSGRPWGNLPEWNAGPGNVPGPVGRSGSAADLRRRTATIVS
jgi:hypothetical protein